MLQLMLLLVPGSLEHQPDLSVLFLHLALLPAEVIQIMMA